MPHNGKIDKSRIFNLTKNFTETVLEGYLPVNFCFTVCYPLWLHFTNNQIECSLVMGDYKGHLHYWLKLNDDEGTVIDPTISQFPESRTSIYFGNNYDYNEATSSDNKDWLLSTRAGWKTRLLFNGSNPLDDINNPSSSKNIPIKTLLDINLKAAVIIVDEFGKLSQEKYLKTYPAIEHYFEDIKEVIQENKDKNKNLIIPIPGIKTLIDFYNKN